MTKKKIYEELIEPNTFMSPRTFKRSTAAALSFAKLAKAGMKCFFSIYTFDNN